MIERKYIFDGKEISPRAYNALKNAGITTLDQLATTPAHELLRLPNFGRTSLNEVNSLLGLEQKQITANDLRKIKSRFYKCLVEMEELKKEFDGLII